MAYNDIVKLLRIILLMSMFLLAAATGYGQDSNGVYFSTAQTVASNLSVAYGSPPTSLLTTNALDLSSTNYSSLSSYVGTGTNADYGSSQQAVISSLFAFGASMDNATAQSVMSIFTGGVPMFTNAMVDSASGTSSVGIVSGSVMRTNPGECLCHDGHLPPAILRRSRIFRRFSGPDHNHGHCHPAANARREAGYCIMDGEGGLLRYFYTQGQPVLQLHPRGGSIGLAAMINGSVMHGIIYQGGLNAWYMKIYGPELLQGVNAVISGTKEPALAKAFQTGYDNYNLQAFLFNENGAALTGQICEYMGGPEAYNGGSGSSGSDPTSGVPLRELEGMYCLEVVYNVGVQNLAAHTLLGDTNAATYTTNFQAACARIYLGNPSITVSDTTDINTAVTDLTISGTTAWVVLDGQGSKRSICCAGFWRIQGTRRSDSGWFGHTGTGTQIKYKRLVVGSGRYLISLGGG